MSEDVKNKAHQKDLSLVASMDPSDVMDISAAEVQAAKEMAIVALEGLKEIVPYADQVRPEAEWASITEQEILAIAS